MKTYIYDNSSKSFSTKNEDDKWVVLAIYNPMSGVEYVTKRLEEAKKKVAESKPHYRNEIVSKEYNTYKEALAEQKQWTAKKHERYGYK